MPRDGSGEVADLWAMVAELERQFAAYKQHLADRNGNGGGDAAAACDDDDASGGGEEEVEPGGGDDVGGDVMRGRMYEAYVRRRDERLRQGWRARMERKEAEVKAFWAQLELSGRRSGHGNSGGGRSSTSGAGDEEGKTERNDDQDKKRSSDSALAPSRISGKKHARTRSFSSSTNTSTNHPDVGGRRALSQEPPPSEPQVAGDAGKESRARRASGAAKTTTTATSRPKTSLRRKNTAKGHGSEKQTGPKLRPRSLPRRAGSGGLEDLSKEVVLLTADAAAPLLRRSYEQEQDVPGEAPEASPPRPSTSIGVGYDGADKAQTASPGSDRSEVVDVVTEGKPEAKDADTKQHRDEVDDASPDKQVGNPNGEITSDSDIEPNNAYINGDIVKEQAMSLPEPQAAASIAVPDEFSAKANNQDNAETTTPPAGATATGIATTNAEEEAPARDSSGGDSSSSSRLGRSPPSSATPSCGSRDQSIERMLEADAVLLRKMREKKRTEKSALKTPGSAGSRVSGTPRSSPRETPKGFKRFLSFGKKNRAREVTVIDCASPSVSSVADDDSGRWQTAGSVSKPRMGSSDAASDGTTDHARTNSPRACSLENLVAASPAKSELAEIVPQGKSPKAHRSFFSLRSLNCGRG